MANNFNNFYTVTEDFRGKKITAQFSGMGVAVREADSTYINGTNITSTKKRAEYLFEHIIVSPKLSINDFGADKIGTKETRTINGVEYTAEFKGLEKALEAQDSCYIDGSNVTSIEKMAKFIFDNIITKPEGLTIDSFETAGDFEAVISFGREVMNGGEAMEEFEEIFTFAYGVMNGNFREKQDKKAVRGTSKE